MARAGSYGKVGMGPKKKKAGPSKPMTFGQAFAKNRKAGKKTFTYKGKKYTTQTKAEVSKKATRKKNVAAKKKIRKVTKPGSGVGVKLSMAARKAARMKARKTRKANRAMRKKS